MSKICFYMAHLAKGGAQRVIINLTEYMIAQGHEVTIVTTNKADVEYEMPKGAKRVMSDIVGDEITSSRIRNFHRRFKKLKKVFRSEDPDVIISFIGLNNMMAIATNLFSKTPVLISVRANPTMEYYTKVLQIISKTLFIKADGIILQTKDQQRYFPKGIQKKCTILPNPLNPEFIAKSDRALLAWEERKQIVAVGRVDGNKNHKMLIEAFTRVAAEYPDWTLKIYGDGEDKGKIDDLIKKSGFADCIEAPGNVSDVPQRLEQARIYTLTSNEEGMPNSLIEAMAKGLACISTDCPCGGPAELIESGENGILIPIEDTDALEKALRDILSNEEYEKKLGSNAEKVKDTLDPKKVCGQWMAYIEKAIDKVK